MFSFDAVLKLKEPLRPQNNYSVSCLSNGFPILFLYLSKNKFKKKKHESGSATAAALNLDQHEHLHNDNFGVVYFTLSANKQRQKKVDKVEERSLNTGSCSSKP